MTLNNSLTGSLHPFQNVFQLLLSNLKLPRTAKPAECVQQVLNFIVPVIRPEMVFQLVPECWEKPQRVDLIIVISNVEKPFTELEPILEFITSVHTHVACSLIQYGQLIAYIQRAELFYLVNCHARTLVYTTGQRKLPAPSGEALWSRRFNAYHVFHGGHHKAGLFLNSALEYAAKADYALAAFMLHQSVEQVLRSMLVAFYGRDQRTHVIKALKKHIRRLAPELMILLWDDTEEDVRLMQLLDDAYLGARYTEDFTVGKEDCETLLEQVKAVVDFSMVVFEDMMKMVSKWEVAE